MRCLFVLCLLWCGSLVAAPPVTSLDNPQVSYQKAKYDWVLLKRDDITAVVVNNEEVRTDLLPDHRAGYSGLARLSHTRQPENLFVPRYAGLNFEHIHDGSTQERDILFEPRRFPMELRSIDENTVELYQAPTGNWKLESCTRYQVIPGNTIEMTFECIPRANTFRNDYIGLFWASYIEAPESKSIHYRGKPKGDEQTQWIEGVTSKHGIKASHLSVEDERTFTHDADFPLSLVFNRSDFRFAEPWYFGVSHGMAYILVFREADQIRFSQSPSGGGGNPAWDFQWFVPKPRVGERYQMVMRAIYVPYESHEQIATVARKHLKGLNSANR